MTYSVIKGKPQLVRDMRSRAVINTDRGLLEQRVREKERIVEFQQVNNDINNLKNEMSEIKSLLMQLISSNEKKQG